MDHISRPTSPEQPDQKSIAENLHKKKIRNSVQPVLSTRSNPTKYNKSSAEASSSSASATQDNTHKAQATEIKDTKEQELAALNKLLDNFKPVQEKKEPEEFHTPHTLPPVNTAQSATNVKSRTRYDGSIRSTREETSPRKPGRTSASSASSASATTEAPSPKPKTGDKPYLSTRLSETLSRYSRNT